MRKALVWILGIILFVVAVKYVGFSQAGKCADLSLEIRGKLGDYATCQADEECTFVQLNCPFDCFTPVRRDRVDDAMSAAASYQRSCMMVCPECPKILPAGARCESGRCVVK